MRRRYLITAAASALAATFGYGRNLDSPPTEPNELRIAMGDDLAIAVDATLKAYEVNLWGLGETLTRISHDGNVVLWLAESVTSVDPLTWRVALRKNARFWDGSAVSAEAVAASFRKNWEVQPDTDPLISKQTEIRVVDAATLEFKTPHPIGNFACQLSYPQFVVHKNGTVMTGPYRPVAYEPDRTLSLEPFREHWKGVPPISRIVVTVVRDREARVQALLSGAVDMAYGLPPELLSRFSPAAYEITSIPSKKLLFMQFNQKRPPFDQRPLRAATSLAVDRAALLRDVMAGHGDVARAIFPSHGGAVDAVETQPTDVARAETMLDEGGWLKGADGVRSRDGQRLAFTLYSFPQVPMMTPLASAIRKQLQPVGYQVTVQEVPNIIDQIRNGEFSAAMRGINTLPTGDTYYVLRAMLGKDGRTNRGGYFNPRIEPLLDDLRGETDHGKRQARSREIQEMGGSDAPYVFLVFVPTTIVTPRGKLQGFVPGPNSQYLIDGTFSVTPGRGAGAAFPETRFVDGLPRYQAREPLSGTIRLWGHGSLRWEFMGPLVKRWADGFRAHHPDVAIENQMVGTATAIGALYAGVGDVAILGEEILPAHAAAFERVLGYPPFGVEIATGSLDMWNMDYAHVFFVHRDNPLKHLTLAQLDGIFGAEHRRGPANIRTWDQVGLTGEWAGKRIRPYGWPIDDDFALYLENVLLAGSHRWNNDLKGFPHINRPDGSIYDHGQRIVDALSADRFGIAVSNLRYAYPNPGVKPLALATSDAGPFYEATRANLISRKYPFTRIVPAYVNRAPGRPLEPRVREFLRYLLSREGQQDLVHHGGYLPLGEQAIREQLGKLE